MRNRKLMLAAPFGLLILAGMCVGLLPGCTESGVPDAGAGEVRLELAYRNLEFELPLDFQSPRDGSNRLFVVEQEGRIRMFDNDQAVAQSSIFLDIANRIKDNGWEEGLLGLAFHPRFVENGYFYVNYTADSPDRTVISRFAVDSLDASIGDPTSEHVILEFEQPYSNHNGGCIAFGPDGYLYIGVGDGGSAGDPLDNGQDRTSLLGTILRIDVDSEIEDRAYAIPPDNPFAGKAEGWREEIWAWGLRNPWRFSFDAETGRLWAADVGQDDIEEIDLIEAGGNYGWKVMEGSQCYAAAECDRTGLLLPVAEYDHDEGKSVTGGYVYRGSNLPALVGKYVYADFMSGRIWSLTHNDDGTTTVEHLFDSDLSISSFGVDANGELYVTAFDGRIYRFVQ